jgi:hypothetical protein
MADSPYNVGFYSRFGFLLTFPTVRLIKETGSVATPSPYTVLGQLETDEALSAITRISQAACPGLDCAPEVSNASEFGWGETLLVGRPQPWAFAVVGTTPKGEGVARFPADVGVLAVQSQAVESLVAVLQAIETFVHSRDLEQVSLAVNTADSQALQQALDYGYRIRAVGLRMVLEGKHTPPKGRVLSKWLM